MPVLSLPLNGKEVRLRLLLSEINTKVKLQWRDALVEVKLELGVAQVANNKLLSSCSSFNCISQCPCSGWERAVLRNVDELIPGITGEYSMELALSQFFTPFRLPVLKY